MKHLPASQQQSAPAFDNTTAPPPSSSSTEALVVVKGCQQRRRSRWRFCCWALLSIFISALVAVIAFFAAAYRSYHAVKPRNLSCSAPPTNTTTIDGFNLCTRLIGHNTSATPVMVVHGGPGHSCLSFKGSLDQLSNHRQVLLYDQRGSGLSQMVAGGDGIYDVNHLVEEMEALRATVLQADHMVILAHSTGGAIAQHYVATYPEHVQALILVGSTRANNDMSSKWLWHVLGPGLYATAMGFPPKDPAMADEWFMKVGNKEDVKRLYDAHKNASVLHDTGPIRFSTWFSVSQSLVGPDLSDQLHQFQSPVLIIYGQSDSPYTGGPTAQTLHDVFPTSQVVGIPHSSHWPFLETPGEFFPIVQDFLLSV